MSAKVQHQKRAHRGEERRHRAELSGASARPTVAWPERTRSLRRLPAVIREGTANPDVKTRDAWGRRLLAAADAAGAILALVLAVVVLGKGSFHLIMLLCGPAMVLAAKLSGLYERDEIVLRKSTLDETPTLFQLATVFTLLVWLFQAPLTHDSLGRGQVAGLWAGSLLALLVNRTLARFLARRILPPERCLALGDPVSCIRIQAKVDSGERLHARVVGALPLTPRRDADPERWSEGEMTDIAERFRAERLLVVPGAGENDELLELVRMAKALGLRVTVIPRVLEVVGSQIEFDDLDGLPVMGVRRFALSRSSRLLKRSLDLSGAVLGLLALAPLMVVLALAVKLDSRGPVLYRHVRVGRGGRRFIMLKFRSMVEDADRRKASLAHLNEAQGLFKVRDDPRVTRVGRLLRRASLDELPQLFNVLRGEMSLVGPRPLIEEEDERIQGADRRRLELTPGMTGNWQILGSARIPLQDMIKIDYLYVAHWSLWTDVKILLRTVLYMLGQRGM